MTIGHEELAAQAKTMRDAADTIQSVVGWINKLERRDGGDTVLRTLGDDADNVIETIAAARTLISAARRLERYCV